MPDLLFPSDYTRSSYTLEDLSDRVLGDLGLRNNNLITSGDIRRWGVEAQTILARDTRSFHLVVVSGVTSGTAEYPIPSLMLSGELSGSSKCCTTGYRCRASR
jgi:hypothetical protein